MSKIETFAAGIFIGAIFGGFLLTGIQLFSGDRDALPDRYTVEELQQAIATREASIATQVAELEASK